MTDERTREAQYQFQLAHDAEYGRAKLGLMTSAAWHAQYLLALCVTPKENPQ